MSLDGNTPARHAQDYLSFYVGEQNFCIDITHVREIRSGEPVTQLPQAPAYMRGVINLRGTVLPILDLSRRLGMPEIPDDPRAVVIVVEGGMGQIGLLVRAVSDILSIPASDLEPVPVSAGQDASSFLTALAVLERGLVKILDLNAVLGPSTDQFQQPAPQ